MPSTKNTNAIHSKYLILHPQQIFNSSAVYIKHTDHLTTSKKANISRICLDIAFNFSRRLADTENKNLSSITASTQNIHIMDIINEEHRYQQHKTKCIILLYKLCIHSENCRKAEEILAPFLSIVQLIFVFKQKKIYFLFLDVSEQINLPTLFFKWLGEKKEIKKAFQLFMYRSVFSVDLQT